MAHSESKLQREFGSDASARQARDGAEVRIARVLRSGIRVVEEIEEQRAELACTIIPNLVGRYSKSAVETAGTSSRLRRNDRQARRSLDPEVLDVLAEIRSTGVLYTGYRPHFVEICRRVAGSLHFADCAVAENGAVLEFPHSGYRLNVDVALPQAFITELRKQGIDFHVGESIVDTHRNDAPRILEIIQRLELPLVLVFNRSRLMILPQAISKATGSAAHWQCSGFPSTTRSGSVMRKTITSCCASANWP